MFSPAKMSLLLKEVMTFPVSPQKYSEKFNRNKNKFDFNISMQHLQKIRSRDVEHRLCVAVIKDVQDIPVDTHRDNPVCHLHDNNTVDRGCKSTYRKQCVFLRNCLLHT